MQNKILVIDFGSQYTQLIARRVRELKVYCQVVHHSKWTEFPLDSSVRGIILSGSYASVFELHTNSLKAHEIGIPILGICYGAQKLVFDEGGQIETSQHREYGKSYLKKLKADILLNNIQEEEIVWMSHGDSIVALPENYTLLAKTKSASVAAFRHNTLPIFAIQFHPEVQHTPCGIQILQNFLFDICKAKADWTTQSFIEETIKNIKSQVGLDQVVMALSGGVDSTVAALLIHQAIGSQLHCVFVDNGLLRKGEFEDTLAAYRKLNLNIKGVDAKEEFYKNLCGIRDSETKRKAIGKTFIDIFEREARHLKAAHWIGQGTIYPDKIESAVDTGGQSIKSHHNVGGLPEDMNLKVLEPIQYLFKDEVRIVGKALNIPQDILQRHPFPGPGLGIRILGEVSQEKVSILQEVDAVFIETLKEKKLYSQIWQAGSILLPVKTVGIMGDARSYQYVVVLRAVCSEDGMTADWYPFPKSVLETLSNRIINQVLQVNRVVYDISSKPPATIEWE